MNYATPFYYAAKALQYDQYQAPQHPRVGRQRRRRIRLMLFPAVRPQRGAATVAPATSSDC